MVRLRFAFPRLYWRERWLFAVVFAGLLLGGLIATHAPSAEDHVTPSEITEAAAIGFFAAILAGLLLERFGWPFWHALANASADGRHLVLKRPDVIDGDTIRDLASGVCYRFANIDAPETGERARCALEAERGRIATLAAIALVRRAQVVSVRTTWRRDIYGRRVAFVYADGVDMGKALVAKGLARPWGGKRERWCGPRGGLAKIGETRAMPVSCKACGAWSRD